MKRFLIMAAVLVACLFSCKKEENPDPGTLGPASITVTLNTTKTSLSGGKLQWSKGDKIAVFDGTDMREFTLKMGAESPTGVFEGQMISNARTLKAIYPFAAARKNGSFFIPVNQTILSGETVDPKCIICNCGPTDRSQELKLTAAVSFFRIKVPAGSTKCTVEIGERTISCNLPGGGTYDLAVEPGTYAGYSLSVEVGGRTYVEKSDEPLSLSVNTVKDITEIETGVHGTVKYNDGKPAVGVSVSDGFDIAVTDQNGQYSLDPSADVRYIYISYPSDAVITTVSNGYPGCPDFFKKYSFGTKEYNFTLARQAVEDKFSLFAMADPQAHYTTRDSQKSADVERFNKEAVPDINNKIKEAGIPCYGVTLGDIVYSENSRNSNPGMERMRTYFNAINMPVFQTMGNHDYTYFYTSAPLKTDSGSSTLYLAAQRKFEDTFGPVNLSFNRGKTHVVCMRNIIYDSNTAAGTYHGGFTDEQWEWFKADLANVPKDYMVVLCVHIPIISSKDHVSDVLNLMKQYTNSTIFSGHTHYYRGYPNVSGTNIYEHIHSAVCGQWWWSKIEGDGCPNGYTMYTIQGNAITDARFTGFNDGMNTPDYQMRIYKGNITTGGKYAQFKWYMDDRTYLINVFSGDSRWKVRVYENGVDKGLASLMSNSKKTFSSVEAGKTYNVPSPSNQDWWAIGYHIGFCKRGTTSTSYYTNMFHMWKYTASSANAQIRVEATDPYGNKYVCSDVITDGTAYPEYIKAPLSIF